MKKPLTHHDKEAAFEAATCSYSGAKARWVERAKTGLTDEELEEALKYELGIAGGSSGCSARPAIHYQGAGLRIWADWDWPNSCIDKPILAGKRTIEMARYVFGIREPNEKQMELL